MMMNSAITQKELFISNILWKRMLLLEIGQNVKKNLCFQWISTNFHLVCLNCISNLGTHTRICSVSSYMEHTTQNMQLILN